jgi:hypothetical protein
VNEQRDYTLEPLEARTLLAEVVAPFQHPQIGTDEIDVATNGELTVAVGSYRASDDGMFVATYNSAGERVSEFPLGGGHGRSAIAMNDSGSFAIAWFNGEGNMRVRRFNSDGTPATKLIAVHNGTALGDNISVAINNSNEFVVAYSRSSKFLTRRLNVWTKKFSPDGQLEHKVRVAGEFLRDERNPDIAMSPDGHGYDILYEDHDIERGVSENDKVILKRFGGSGKLRSTRVIAENASAGSISISPDGTVGLVSWHTEDREDDITSIFARRYNGKSLFDEFLVEATDELRGEVDVAVFNTGVAIANLGGLIHEDPEELTDDGEVIIDMLRMTDRPGVGWGWDTAGIAIASDGSYVAGASIPDGPRNVESEAWLMFGAVPEIS